MDDYVIRGGKKLRTGYTTGSCAAGAAKAAALLLFTGNAPDTVRIHTPAGRDLFLSVEEPAHDPAGGSASAAVRKDGGDDVDATDGLLVFADVRKTAPPQAGTGPDGEDTESRIVIRGGEGVGVVTKPGLDQPPGEAAINSVPRAMTRAEVGAVMSAYRYSGGLEVTIRVPDGRKAAARTFNPRLGIEGGISILGTSGIVEPMSTKALLDSIRVELNQRRALGERTLLLAPGNYGIGFLKNFYGIPETRAVKCSNFIGDSLDMAAELGFSGVLLVGHIGKLVKIGSGIMNTHSHVADGRLETFAACGVEAGVPIPALQRMLSSNTTEDAIESMRGDGIWDPVLRRLLLRIERKLSESVGNRCETGCVLFSTREGYLGETEKAQELLRAVREAEGADGGSDETGGSGKG